ARQLDTARARIGRHEHQPELRGHALRPGLDHESLFGAREAREVVEHRHPTRIRLGGCEHRKSHGARGARRFVTIEADRTAEAAMLTDDLERLAGHGALPMNCRARAPYTGRR